MEDNLLHVILSYKSFSYTPSVHPASGILHRAKVARSDCASNGRLQRLRMMELLNCQPQNLVVVAYRRWSFTLRF